MEIDTLFDRRKNDPQYNTSYPLNPKQWEQYRVRRELDFSGCRDLSFYIHIPFCQHLCSFCEYQRTLLPSHIVQMKYLKAVQQDIDWFLTRYPSRRLRGFDIGGGTPTALDDDSFSFLMEIYRDTISRVEISNDFEPSIEGTFQTICPTKLKQIVRSGIKRLSIGIQSSVNTVQKKNGRVNPEIFEMSDKLLQVHESGIEKVNLDLMYGLKGQTLQDISSDVSCIQYLNPEQVTLYDLRTNMINCKDTSSKERLFSCYNLLYHGLLDQGYTASFGQNTFSKNSEDKGLSSYLRNRMIHFLPYKGFGLSAQSLSDEGVSYNIGKRSHSLKGLIETAMSYPSGDSYGLPAYELLSKYIAISAYYGRISVPVAERILKKDFKEAFSKEIDFCMNNGYIELNGDVMNITRKGFQYYGAIFSLFYDPLTE